MARTLSRREWVSWRIAFLSQPFNKLLYALYDVTGLKKARNAESRHMVERKSSFDACQLQFREPLPPVVFSVRSSMPRFSHVRMPDTAPYATKIHCQQ